MSVVYLAQNIAIQLNYFKVYGIISVSLFIYYLMERNGENGAEIIASVRYIPASGRL